MKRAFVVASVNSRSSYATDKHSNAQVERERTEVPIKYDLTVATKTIHSVWRKNIAEEELLVFIQHLPSCFSASRQKKGWLLCFFCFIRRFPSTGAAGASQSHAAEAKNTSLMNFALYSLCCRFPSRLPLFRWLLALICFYTAMLLAFLRTFDRSFLNLRSTDELSYSVFNHSLARFFLSSSLPVWLGSFWLWHPLN